MLLGHRHGKARQGGVLRGEHLSGGAAAPELRPGCPGVLCQAVAAGSSLQTAAFTKHHGRAHRVLLAPRTSPLLLSSGPGSAWRSIWREAKGAQTQHGAGCGSQGLSASLSQRCAQPASGQSSGIGPTGSRCSGWGLLVPSRQEEGLPSPGEWEFCKREVITLVQHKLIDRKLIAM